MKNRITSDAALQDKTKKAAQAVCKQGMVQFPVSDTAVAIIAARSVTVRRNWI